MTPVSSSTKIISDVPTSFEPWDQDYQDDDMERNVLAEPDDRSRTSNNVLQFSKDRGGKAGTAEEIESFTETVPSIATRKSLLHIPISRGGESHRPSIEFTKVVRAHFTKPILDALQKAQPHALSPNASVYINDILHQIRQMEHKIPHDPFLEILYAFYDALAFKNKWMDFDATQFAMVREVLKRFAERSELRQSEIEKAIMKLEEIGFDTTPIPMAIDDEE
ncbi:MAG: hypothetical protein Q7K29_06855 [Thermoleophilia bacterium]|nr:hypothetical protein [Thermoleophilia bacterium]